MQLQEQLDNIISNQQGINMHQDENSYYSNDEEYFLDICRAGELDELKEFVNNLSTEANFDWACISNSQDNFLHMLAANNLTEMFDYIFPIVAKKLSNAKIQELINKQNSTGNTPIHYAVITNSKQMVLKLLEIKVDVNLLNDANRTPYAEAEEFDKIQIAEMLAPLMKNNLGEMKKEFQMLDICNQDEDEDQQQGQQIEQKPQESREMKEDE